FRRLASQCVARSAHSRLAPRGARCNSGRRHIVWGMTKGGSGKAFNRMALLASPTERAQEAAEALAACADWVPIEQAEVAVVLGGDGFMLETMHRMIEVAQLVPLYGLNLGTVGFLMNRYTKGCRILDRLAKARPIAVSPLRMEAVTQDGTSTCFHAINEVSLLRE